MQQTVNVSRGTTAVRRLFRSSEAALVVMAVALGFVVGLFTFVMNRTAHGVQSIIYGLNYGQSLSATPSISLLSLLALPIGGLLLGFATRAAARRWRTPVDVVEANALPGGV